ncbi:MAG: hypothetical protein ACOYXB_17865, partial [Bacteroidota bacterium]
VLSANQTDFIQRVSRIENYGHTGLKMKISVRFWGLCNSYVCWAPFFSFKYRNRPVMQPFYPSRNRHFCPGYGDFIPHGFLRVYRGAGK